MEKFLGAAAAIDPLKEEWLAGKLSEYDRVPLAGYLRSLGASPGAIADIQATLSPSDGPDDVSALHILREMANIRREQALEGGGRIAGGSDNVPKGLAARLGERVIYGAGPWSTGGSGSSGGSRVGSGVYAGGKGARALTALPEKERIAQVLAIMEKTHPGMKERAVATASKCWDEDPVLAGGARPFCRRSHLLPPRLHARGGRLGQAGRPRDRRRSRHQVKARAAPGPAVLCTTCTGTPARSRTRSKACVRPYCPQRPRPEPHHRSTTGSAREQIRVR